MEQGVFMDYQVLYRKYRPHDFDSLVGQEYTKKLLKNSVINNKFAHAYIFTGPRGTGKTSSAKIFAKAINCLHPIDGNPCNKCKNCVNFESSPDIIELDAASNNGVDDIREIINNVRLAPSSMKIKVYIIDEFHMLSTSAFNALLLTLEEPPKDVVFILATTDIQSVPITVLSRCQRFDFKPISIQDIENRLKFVCGEENLKVTDDAIKEIAMMSNGGLRDALSILDQVAGNGEEIDIQDVIANFGGISNKKINQLLSYYENNSVAELIDYINEIKNLINNDPDVNNKMKVIFVSNYDVSYAEKIIPAADISEQISTAGTEASGTGNMKLMLNGAVTLGTFDGANIEIVEQAGLENNYIFGAPVDEINILKNNYNPQEIYDKNPQIRRILNTLVDGTFDSGSPNNADFQELFDSILKGASWHAPDAYFLLQDLPDYVKAKIKAINDYKNCFKFGQMCLKNVASAGFFSSDRAVKEYAENIWKI